MLFDWYTVSEKGRHLDTNEDCVLAEPGYGLFVVADGMGGRPGGAQASRVAARTFVDEVRRRNPFPRIEAAVLRQAVQAANDAIRAIARTEPMMTGMGTTLTAVVLGETGGQFVHVGDSRLYGFVGGRIEQLTEDHTLAAELVARDFLSDAAERGPLHGILSRVVGTRPTVEADIGHLALAPDEWLLLATDGLTKTVPPARLEELFSATQRLGASAVGRAIMKAAMEADPRDNVTIAVVRPVGGARGGR